MQAAWFAVLNTVFMAWWCPATLRVRLLRLFGATVGKRVLIRHRVRVKWPWKLTIGDDVWIGEGAWLINSESVTIEDDVCLSQEAFICDSSHDPSDPAFELLQSPIRLCQGSWVASRAMVLRGVTVGPGAVVGAGAVIRKNYGAPGRSAPVD
ncbi:MAG: DapH/DapD/GlmU-related protein [Pseudonocardiales bacterium]